MDTAVRYWSLALAKDPTMKHSKSIEEQVTGIQREQKAVAKTEGLRRWHRICSATLHASTARFGRMEVPDVKDLKALEAEIIGSKQPPAESRFDQAALNNLLSRKWERRR